ncbi:MAG TPA: hypothetical protein VHT00_03515 [Stellaceae bacterium]|jgi:hypothetical protein|nr:hypothetical protein [Stellaceae bacterium]
MGRLGTRGEPLGAILRPQLDLGSEFEKCKKEVEYAALESGDSVVLVDDSADRVLSAARSLQRAVRRFQMPQDFRFGAAVGAIAFSTPTDGQSVRVPSAGIVIRGADRAACRARHDAVYRGITLRAR